MSSRSTREERRERREERRESVPRAQCGSTAARPGKLHVAGGELTWGGLRALQGREADPGAGMPLELVALREPLATEEPVADEGRRCAGAREPAAGMSYGKSAAVGMWHTCFFCPARQTWELG